MIYSNSCSPGVERGSEQPICNRICLEDICPSSITVIGIEGFLWSLLPCIYIFKVVLSAIKDGE